jgi:hypothetical protein
MHCMYIRMCARACEECVRMLPATTSPIKPIKVQPNVLARIPTKTHKCMCIPYIYIYIRINLHIQTQENTSPYSSPAATSPIKMIKSAPKYADENVCNHMLAQYTQDPEIIRTPEKAYLQPHGTKRPGNALAPGSRIEPTANPKRIRTVASNWMSPHAKRKMEVLGYGDARNLYRVERALATAQRDDTLFSYVPERVVKRPAPGAYM